MHHARARERRRTDKVCVCACMGGACAHLSMPVHSRAHAAHARTADQPRERAMGHPIEAALRKVDLQTSRRLRLGRCKKLCLEGAPCAGLTEEGARTRCERRDPPRDGAAARSTRGGSGAAGDAGGRGGREAACASACAGRRGGRACSSAGKSVAERDECARPSRERASTVRWRAGRTVLRGAGTHTSVGHRGDDRQ